MLLENKFKKESLVAIKLARNAGVLIKRHYDAGIGHSVKADHTFVTKADTDSNNLILKGLAKNFPKDGVVSEESKSTSPKAKRVWYVDPLDGTNSFVRRQGEFSVHIGLALKGKPVLGVVHKPLSGETYIGIPGVAAYKISKSGSKKKLVVNKSLPGIVAAIERQMKGLDEYKRLLKTVGATSFEITGGEGLRILKIVDGLANTRLSTMIGKSWDLCAPQAILEAAGGISRYAGTNKKIIYHGQARMSGVTLFASSQKTLKRVNKSLANHKILL